MAYTIIKGEQWTVQVSPKYKTKEAAHRDAVILRHKGYDVRVDSITRVSKTTKKKLTLYYLIKKKRR